MNIIFVSVLAIIVSSIFNLAVCCRLSAKESRQDKFTLSALTLSQLFRGLDRVDGMLGQISVDLARRKRDLISGPSAPVRNLSLSQMLRGLDKLDSLLSHLNEDIARRRREIGEIAEFRTKLSSLLQSSSLTSGCLDVLESLYRLSSESLARQEEELLQTLKEEAKVKRMYRKFKGFFKRFNWVEKRREKRRQREEAMFSLSSWITAPTPSTYPFPPVENPSCANSHPIADSSPSFNPLQREEAFSLKQNGLCEVLTLGSLSVLRNIGVRSGIK